jgi:hypothetical protein
VLCSNQKLAFEDAETPLAHFAIHGELTIRIMTRLRGGVGGSNEAKQPEVGDAAAVRLSRPISVSSSVGSLNRNFFATKGAWNFGSREQSIMRWKNAEGFPSQIKNLRAAYLKCKENSVSSVEQIPLPSRTRMHYKLIDPDRR